MSKILLLNADYTPLNINPLSTLSWKDAIKLEFTGAAEVVEYYDDWVVHSPSTEMFVPAVMRLKEYVKFNKKVKFSSRNIYLRDNFTCQYCGNVFSEKLLSKDHVLPKKHGGKTTWDNIVTACVQCNNKKGHDKSITPLIDPYVPNAREMEHKATNKIINIYHPSWLDFIENRWDNTLINKMYLTS